MKKKLIVFADYILTISTIFLGGLLLPLLVSVFLCIFTDTFFSDCIYSPFFWIGSCAGWIVYAVNLQTRGGI
jgi:hypothetical protein